MRPDFSVAQHIAQHGDLAAGGHAFRRGAAGKNIIMLGLAEPLVLAGVAIDQPIGDEIGQAEEGRDAEAPAPAKLTMKKATSGTPMTLENLAAESKIAVERLALVARKPVAGGFLVAGHAGGFGDAQQQPRRENTGIAAGQMR